MATIKFLLKGKSNPSTLFVRLRDGRQIDLTSSIGLSINPDYWNNERGIIRQRAEFKDKLNFQRQLEELSDLILAERNRSFNKGRQLNSIWLDDIILQWRGLNISEKSDLLVVRMDLYRLSLNTKIYNGKIGVSAGAIRNYNTTMQRLKKYEAAKKIVLRLTDLDLNFHAHYVKYAKTILGLSTNSIGKDIKNIRTVCLEAKDNGFIVHDNVLSKNFKIPTEKTIFTTLTETELNAINLFNGPDFLMNAKDWLIIGCWTGCRVGDLMELSMNNVFVHSSGAKLIQYTQSKTGKTVKVPMHPHVEGILERRGGFPRAISDQKFNNYIKELCKRVGLTQKIYGTRQNPESHLKELGYFEKWQLIKSHTCRRSFATNHYSKLSNKLIMAVTGHATEQMLLKYIGEVESDHIPDFMNLWNNQSVIRAVV